MKKTLIISSFFLVLIFASTIGYKVVSANTKIDEVDDIITYQESKEEYLTHYHYTLDNPNIVLNPYGISPLTALIIFETSDEEEVTITIMGHDENSTYTNKFKKTKKHYIPVFGLYPNYDNEIIIKCGNITKKYNIKTEKLPEDFQKENKQNNTNNLYFVTTNKYPYAIDNNNEVRWYLTNNYTGKISRLENGNLLLSTSELIDESHYKGLIELDLLGKVYHEYDNYDGYYGSYAETKNTILVLSKNIIEIDKQNGEIIRTIKLKNNYDTISYDSNNIILKNTNEILTINYKKETTKTYNNFQVDNEHEILLPLYNLNSYQLSKGIKFTNNKETKESSKNILLLNYKKIDSNYENHNFNIIKESDRLIVNTSIDKNEKVYIILDKFLDKKVYDLKNGYNYINSKGLSGDYSIYIKINDIIYKTNKYVTF